MLCITETSYSVAKPDGTNQKASAKIKKAECKIKYKKFSPSSSCVWVQCFSDLKFRHGPLSSFTSVGIHILVLLSVKANSMLGSASMGTASRLRLEITNPYLSLALFVLHLGSVLGAQFRKATEKIE